MKIKLITFLLSITTIYNVNGQDKTASFNVGEDDELLQVSSMGDNGLVVKTGKYLPSYAKTKNVNWKLKYFDLDLNEKWEVPIDKHLSGMNQRNILIPSSSN